MADYGDFSLTQEGVYSTIVPKPKVTPEEQERIEQERKEDAHHRIGEVVEGLEDTSKRKHHEIGSDFGEWVEAREEKIEEPAQIEEQKRTPEESQQPPESKETKAEEPKIPEPEEEPEPEPEAGANAQAIAKQVAIEVARTAASQADVSSINDKLDQLPEGLFNMDGTAGSGNVPMLGINGTWYYGTVEGGKPFSGNVWVGGKKVVVPDATTSYLKVPFNGDDCTWVGAIPDIMDEDSEVFDITQTAGDIHLPGNYGRNS